jgi:ketosteroid isomerase-like protein
MTEPALTATSRRTANLLVEHMTRGNFAALLDLFHDDATWQVLGNPSGFSHARTYRKDEIGQWFQKLGETVTTPTGMDIEGVMADGANASLQIHATGETANGKNYDHRELFLLDIEDGKIKRLQAYSDTLHLQDVLGE